MIKLLIGGSPCTYWSISQKNGRETAAEGIGWELFKNYLIAKEKFNPDFFLYENNKSAAEPIKAQIRKELGVTEPSLFENDNGVRFTLINSALVSAQNRQRFYVTNFGDIEQPADRGILLKDILETGLINKEKAYCLKHQAGNARDHFKKHHTNIAFEPVCVAERGRQRDGKWEQQVEAREDNKTNALTTVQKDNQVCEPIVLNTVDGKSGTIRATCYKDGIRNLVANTVDRRSCVAEPVNTTEGGKSRTVKAQYYKNGTANFVTNGGFGATAVAGPVCMRYERSDEAKKVYEVKDGLITVNGKQYPIKLADGFYIIRKLTVTECCRLQTMPDFYMRAVSSTQGYKGLGNGWTAEVIIHLLQHAKIPLDEEIVVCSMYDGIGTGRYVLDKMGYKNVTYHAYEIDKYAMQVSMSNYPDIIQHGDAFAVRNDDWQLDSITKE